MFSHRLLGLICVAVLPGALTSSCAARRPTPQLVAEQGRADSLLREGCFRCLQDALAVYERLAADPRGPGEARRRAFEAAILLSVRAREIGLPSDALVERARGWSAPPPSAAAVRPPPVAPVPLETYLAALDLIAGEITGFDPEARQERSARLRKAIGAGGLAASPVRAALSAVAPSDIVAEYLVMAMDCEDVAGRKAVRPDVVLARHGHAPLLRFRVAMCSTVEPMGRLRETDPRWVDSLFFEGRLELAGRPAAAAAGGRVTIVADVGKAAALFEEARAAFPESTAIVMALGHARASLEEHDDALAAFDSVLAGEPTHRDAMLGRLVSLSYLMRHGAAESVATRMIDLGTWHMGDAYYWRAWNRYHTYALDPAWSDIELGRKLLVNTDVYALAGYIAYARKDLDTAIDRFDQAFKLDDTNCDAVWSEGLVHVDMQAWPKAAPRFSRAMTCYTSAAAKARADIAGIAEAALPEATSRRRLAAAQKRLDLAAHRTAQSGFNAAQSYARLGQKVEALAHVSVAAEHPLLSEKAGLLRTAIEKLPD